MISKINFYTPIIKTNNCVIKNSTNKISFTSLYDYDGDHVCFNKQKPEIKKYNTPKDYDMLRTTNEFFGVEPETLLNVYTKRDKETGVAPIHTVDENGLRIILEEFKNDPQALKELFTAQDDQMQMPAFYYSPEALEVMNEALENQPETLAQIYTHKNLYNLTLEHKIDGTVDKTKQKIKEKTFETHADFFTQLYLTQDENGNLPAHINGSRYVEIMHEVLKNQKDALIEIHTTPNNEGRLIAHQGAFWREIYTLKAINETFKNDPAVLERIYLTPDNNGNLPIHLANPSGIEIIAKALSFDSGNIKDLFLTANYDGNLVAHKANDYELQIINKALKGQPEALALMYFRENCEGKPPVWDRNSSRYKIMTKALQESAKEMNRR